MRRTEEVAAARGLAIQGVVARRAAVEPEAVALTDGRDTFSYGDLAKSVDLHAQGLLGLGLGDAPVAVISRNRIEVALLLLACAEIGVPVAPLNWRQSATHIRAMLDLVAPEAVVVSAEFADLAPDDRLTIALDAVDGPSALHWTDVPTDHGLELPPVDHRDVLTIMSTSGSTGAPKGVVLTHGALAARAEILTAELSIDQQDAFLGWAPMFHISSTDYLFTTLLRGGTFVVIDEYTPELVADLLERYAVGWLMLMPGMLRDLSDALQGRRVRGVKCVGAMADLVPREEMARLCRLLDAPYLNSFGSTEAGLAPVATLLDERRGWSLRKTPHRHCQLRLVDEDAKDVPLGDVGELVLRGPTLFSGYLNDPMATSRAFAGGWFHTGDLMRLAPDGSLEFVDRKAYMLKSGGENVYPAVIERALKEHPAINEATVVKVDHPRWGESPCAFVSCDDPAMDHGHVLDHLRGRVAKYELPTAVHIIDLAEFPRGPTGKVLRQELERRAAAMHSPPSD